MKNEGKVENSTISSENWQKVKNIFLDALEIEEPDREKFLSETCGDDSELRIEVEKLLAVHFRSENFIEKPAAEINSLFQPDGNRNSSKRFGNYKIIRQIGRGGMSEDGLPYLVMEYVGGTPLDQYCDEHSFST